MSSPAHGAAPPRRVFLSHTAELRRFPARRSFIEAAEQSIKRAGFAVNDMSYFPARVASPGQACIDAVREADIFVLVAGFHYGVPVVDRPDLSYNELEFDTAIAAGLPTLVFVLGSETEGPSELFLDPSFGERQLAFRTRLAESGQITATVTNPAELSESLFIALSTIDEGTPHQPGAPQKPEHTVFVSHTHDHEEFAEALAAGLRKSGASVWNFRDDVIAGEDSRTATERAMTAARTLILFVEPRPSRLQEREWADALAQTWTSKKSIVPLLLDGARAPAGLRPWQPITVDDPSRVDDNLLGLIQERATAAPAEPAPSGELASRLDTIGIITNADGRRSG